MTFPHSPDDKPPACGDCDDTGVKLVSCDVDPATDRLVFTYDTCACGAKPLLDRIRDLGIAKVLNPEPVDPVKF